MVFWLLAADHRAQVARLWILLALFVLGVAPSASAINTTGLVAHYAFDGNANDDSGNANNGTVAGGAAFTSGKTGSALAITNGTQYVSGPNVTVGTSFSFAGWYKIDSAQTVQGTIGQWYSFFNTSQYCGTTLLGMMYNRPSGYIRIYPAGSGCSGAHDIPVTLPLDAWLHFATTYDGTAIRTYVNGMLIDQFAYTVNIAGSQQLIVGASVPNVAYNWIGAIDDVYVFSRVLTLAEIQALASAPSSCGVPVTSVTFSDTFQGTSLDPTKWATGGVGTGGTISVTPGVAQFNVSGDILFAQTINSPIPTTGDFSVYCKGRHYLSGASHGSLCSAHHNAWPSVAGVFGNDTYWRPYARYGRHGAALIVSTGPPGSVILDYNNPADIGSTHEWELCVRGDTVEHFRDGVLLGSAALPPGWIRPKFVAMGNPGSPGPPFTSLETNAIEVRRLAMSAVPGLVGN